MIKFLSRLFMLGKPLADSDEKVDHCLNKDVLVYRTDNPRHIVISLDTSTELEVLVIDRDNRRLANFSYPASGVIKIDTRGKKNG